LKLLPDGLVRIELKHPFNDGHAPTFLPGSARQKLGPAAVDLDPLSLLCTTQASWRQPPAQGELFGA
jgi:hypothetical protein